MATSLQFADFVCDQLQLYGAVRAKKMFGEYMVYLNEKPILLLCDNTVFVKKLPQTAALLQLAPCGIPYAGAKEHFILDVEQRELLDALIPVLEAVTPLPKRKKPKEPLE